VRRSKQASQKRPEVAFGTVESETELMGGENLAFVWLPFAVACCAGSHPRCCATVLLVAGAFSHRHSGGSWGDAACSGESCSQQWEEKFFRGGFKPFNFSCGRTKLKTSGSLPEWLCCPLLFSLSFSSRLC